MIIVEGTIGAGKSTFLKMLQQYLPEHAMALEPLDQWHDGKQENSLLTLFYKDPSRWAYSFELKTLMSRVRDYAHYKRLYGKQLMVERSIFSGRYCFAYNSFCSGYLSEPEWMLYQHWFDFLMAQYTIQPTAFIYLRIEPQKALERIKKRRREGEDIPLSYLQSIGFLHDQFLLERKMPGALKDVPVLCLDVNEEFEHSPSYFEEQREKVDRFIREIR